MAMVNNFKAYEKCIRDMEEQVKESVAAAILEEIKSEAPYDTGRLQQGYEIGVEGDKLVLYSAVDYWQFVEFGTSRQRAQPHIRPAFNNRRLIEDAINEVVAKNVRDVRGL